MANKIKYGLSNVYFALATDDGSGNLTYDTPVAWRGAVNLSLSASGDENTFYADNIPYFVTTANNGYSGTLETALVPESFRTTILGEQVGANGIAFEQSDILAKQFALLFQFEGDETATRHVLYNCTASRPDVAGATKEASISPQTETINLTALPRESDHITKGKIADKESVVYQGWFDAVTLPTAKEEQNPGEEEQTTGEEEG